MFFLWRFKYFLMRINKKNIFFNQHFYEGRISFSILTIELYILLKLQGFLCFFYFLFFKSVNNFFFFFVKYLYVLSFDHNGKKNEGLRRGVVAGVSLKFHSPCTMISPFSLVQKLIDFGKASLWHSRVICCPSRAPTSWFWIQIIGGTLKKKINKK